jgi:hypothetical protein
VVFTFYCRSLVDAIFRLVSNIFPRFHDKIFRFLIGVDPLGIGFFGADVKRFRDSTRDHRQLVCSIAWTEWMEADVDSLLVLFAISSPECPRHLHSFLSSFILFIYFLKFVFLWKGEKNINDDSRQQHPGGTCHALSLRGQFVPNSFCRQILILLYDPLACTL